MQSKGERKSFSTIGHISESQLFGWVATVVQFLLFKMSSQNLKLDLITRHRVFSMHQPFEWLHVSITGIHLGIVLHLCTGLTPRIFIPSHLNIQKDKKESISTTPGHETFMLICSATLKNASLLQQIPHQKFFFIISKMQNTSSRKYKEILCISIYHNVSRSQLFWRSCLLVLSDNS